MENNNINTLSPARIILAFLVGIIVFAAGFFIGSLLGSLTARLAIILPISIDITDVVNTASAILSFGAGFAAFNAIVKGKGAFVASYVFISLMILFAICYAIGCIISKNLNLIWYSVLGIGLSIFFIYMTHKEQQENKETSAKNQMTDQ